MAKAHAAAESERAKDGYSGGSDGSAKVSLASKSTTSNSSSKTPGTVSISSSTGGTKKVSSTDGLNQQEKSIYLGATLPKDGKSYAYTDDYGFEHVGDQAQALAYSGNGKTFEYNGASGGGYARDANGNRAMMGLDGSVDYGNAPLDDKGNIIRYKAAGTFSNVANSGSKENTNTLAFSNEPTPQGSASLNTVSNSGDSQSIIKQAQAAWAKANQNGDTAGMEAAHATAEKARASMGYSGGTDGTKYNAFQTVQNEAVPASTFSGSGYGGMDQTEYMDTLMKKAKSGVNQSANTQYSSIQQNLDDVLSQLDAEKSTLDPTYQDALGSIKAREFSSSEAAKELMNQSGWNTTNSGLSIGELNKISMQSSDQQASAKEDLVKALEDVVRRSTLAQTKASNEELAVDQWKAQALATAQADALIQADSRNYGQYTDNRNFGLQSDQFDFTKQNADRTYDRGVVESDRNSLLQQAQLEWQKATDQRDYDRGVLESNTALKLAAAKAAKSGSGSGSSGAKVSESQLNTLMNNFNKAITSNPYFKYDYSNDKQAAYTTPAQKKTILDNYIANLMSKINAGAIDPATGQAMLSYVEKTPEYMSLIGQ